MAAQSPPLMLSSPFTPWWNMEIRYQQKYANVAQVERLDEHRVSRLLSPVKILVRCH